MEDKNAACIKGAEGYTLVELVTVLAILAILGTMLLSMLNAGTKFYRSANSTMDNQNNSRLGVAYITVKIRQNDVANGISVVQPLSSDATFNVLKINDANSTSGNVFWIYFDGSTHKLREQSGDSGFNQDLETGAEIADLSYCEIEQSGANIHLEVKSIDQTVDLTQDITLRTSY